MIPKKTLGNVGEIKACEYIESTGYMIIERNYRCIFGEIDIIAVIDNIISFIEVKTRTSMSYGEPEEALNQTKIRRIKKVAASYLGIKQLYNVDVSFDVISIKVDNKKLLLHHFKNCF